MICACKSNCIFRRRADFILFHLNIIARPIFRKSFYCSKLTLRFQTFINFFFKNFLYISLLTLESARNNDFAADNFLWITLFILAEQTCCSLKVSKFYINKQFPNLFDSIIRFIFHAGIIITYLGKFVYKELFPHRLCRINQRFIHSYMFFLYILNLRISFS